MRRLIAIAIAVMASGLAPPAEADPCLITGDVTLSCGGITYRAVDDECVHYVDLAAHNTSHPGVALPDLKKKIADNYDAGAVPPPVVVELTDFVDCTTTGHNFTDANMWSQSSHPNKPSRLMAISGRTFRITAAPDDGFATYYYSYDLATGAAAGLAHLLVVESSNDQERYTSLQIHHPDTICMPGLPWATPYGSEPTFNPWGDPWYDQNIARIQQGPCFGPDVGLDVYTGRDLPLDNKPFNIPMIFHAKTAAARVAVSSTGCTVNRSGTDGGAASRMWLFKFVSDMNAQLPQLTLPAAGPQRRIGLYVTHPWYLYAHNGTPVRLLQQRQEGLQRTVRHLRYCGFNYLAFNAINGSDRTGKSWYPGSAYFDWNSAGDLLSELPPICQAEGVQLVPLITSLRQPTYDGGLTFSGASFQMRNDGADYTRAFGDPTLDPLRPEVQQLTFNLLGEIASRCAASPAVCGIGIRANGKIGTCYTADGDGTRGAKLSGYSTWDLQQFKNATGINVPTSSPSNGYNWLIARPNEWNAWITWRCEGTRAFWLACRDLIKTYRSDLVFYVQCDLPSETPGTNIEWANGEAPRELLRQHGYDPDLFVNDTGIVISRGMMVAEDRFNVSTRWGPPWGTNYQNYKLFHYAPGLAELYRTAQGKACEFYQVYWEENGNPYYEFGAPGDTVSGFFRTQTPAAPGRAFFEGATMSLRRQDPDTLVWLGWNRPTLGHEADLRKFAVAFRALPAVSPTAFAGTVTPTMDQIVARWYADRLAVINDTSSGQTITLSFAAPVPLGDSLVDVVSGRQLISSVQTERQNVSFPAEAFSLNVFLYRPAAGPVADFTTGPLPTDLPLTVQFQDASTAGNITAWDWDFGDGSPHASNQNPAHSYATFGTYSVTLTITSGDGTLARTKPIALVASPPTVISESPARSSSLNGLTSISVTFSEPVTGVDASDLTVNGSHPTQVFGSGAGPYVFTGFAAPAVGAVQVALASGGIADASGTAFAGDNWPYTVLGPPVPGVDNPSFEDNGGSLNGWQIVHINGEWPDNPPWSNSNQWNVVTPYGTHFAGKITNGLAMDFYLGQVVGVSNWDPFSTSVNWQFGAYAQLRCTHENQPNPTGVHQVWEIGWNDNGSEPADVMSCDHYQVLANIDGTATGNDTSFHPLQASGSITGVTGLRGVAVRVHMYNDHAWWWTFGNCDNVSLIATSVPAAPVPGDLDGDHHVDEADVAIFTSCMTGAAAGPPSTPCLPADLDGDDDVDQSDFGLLQRCLSGPNATPSPGCAG